MVEQDPGPRHRIKFSQTSPRARRGDGCDVTCVSMEGCRRRRAGGGRKPTARCSSARHRPASGSARTTHPTARPRRHRGQSETQRRVGRTATAASARSRELRGPTGRPAPGTETRCPASPGFGIAHCTSAAGGSCGGRSCHSPCRGPARSARRDCGGPSFCTEKSRTGSRDGDGRGWPRRPRSAERRRRGWVRSSFASRHRIRRARDASATQGAHHLGPHRRLRRGRSAACSWGLSALQASARARWCSHQAPSVRGSQGSRASAPHRMQLTSSAPSTDFLTRTRKNVGKRWARSHCSEPGQKAQVAAPAHGPSPRGTVGSDGRGPFTHSRAVFADRAASSNSPANNLHWAAVSAWAWLSLE